MPDFSRSNYNTLWDDHLDAQTKTQPPLLSQWHKEDSVLSRTLPSPIKPQDHRPRSDGVYNAASGHYEEPWSTSNATRTTTITIPAQQHPQPQYQQHHTGSSLPSAGHQQWQQYPSSSMIHHATIPAPPLSSSSTASNNSTSPYPDSTSSPSYHQTYYAREDEPPRTTSTRPPILQPSPQHFDNYSRVSKYTPHTPHYPTHPSTPPSHDLQHYSNSSISGSGGSSRSAGPIYQHHRMLLTPKSAKSEKERGRREKHNRAIERLRKALPTALGAGTKTDIVESGSEHIRGVGRDLDVVRELVENILSAAETATHDDGVGQTGVESGAGQVSLKIGRGVRQEEIKALKGLLGWPRRTSS